MKQQNGFTLIEMVVFILVIGIVATALVASFDTSLRTGDDPAKITEGIELAQERMELILGQREQNGYTSLSDPCVPAPNCTLTPSSNFCPACEPPSEYTVSSTLTTGVDLLGNGDTNYTRIVVTTNRGSQKVGEVTTIVADY